jgi:hypothetical protein
MFADIPRVQTQLVNAGFKRHQSQLVVKVDVRNDGNFRHSLANLPERYSSVIVRHSEPYYLATGADHLFDLSYRRANVCGVGLSHRLHHDRCAATDLNVANLYGSRLSHNAWETV